MSVDPSEPCDHQLDASQLVEHPYLSAMYVLRRCRGGLKAGALYWGHLQ